LIALLCRNQHTFLILNGAELSLQNYRFLDSRTPSNYSNPIYFIVGRRNCFHATGSTFTCRKLTNLIMNEIEVCRIDMGNNNIISQVELTRVITATLKHTGLLPWVYVEEN